MNSQANHIIRPKCTYRFQNSIYLKLFSKHFLMNSFPAQCNIQYTIFRVIESWWERWHHFPFQSATHHNATVR